MKKVILKQSGSELGHAIVEDDKAQEMQDIYLNNYQGEEYSVEIVDVTDQVNQLNINKESLSYLESTDWYIIREMDSGVQCPADIKQARNEARARIVK